MTATFPRQQRYFTNSAPQRCWDAIFIGSGMGSLAAAAALAKLGQAVLVLEAHSKLGGLTHTFQRRQNRWGTGLHYTGWPTSYPCDFPDLWQRLTDGHAPWQRLPDDNDIFLRDGAAFVKRSPRDRFRDDLHAAFPGERPAIDRYFADLRQTTADLIRFMPLQALPPLVERLGIGWLLGRRFLRADRLPLVDYMNQIGASERLRDHLWFTWGNFGGIPTETSFGSYAIPNEFLLDGLWTQPQGAHGAADAFAATICAAGGELRHSARVTSLVFEGSRVAGVRVGAEEIRGRVVVSGMGACETYRLLVPPERQPTRAADVLAMKPSCSLFTLYLALDRRVLERYGLTGVNYWMETVPGGIRNVWSDWSAPPPALLLSLAARFTDSITPRPQGAGLGEDSDTITAEVFTCVAGERFAPWNGTRVRKRGAEYDDLKNGLTEQLLQQLDRTWPGIRQCIRYAEGASPLTIESYTGHVHGAAYGLAPVVGRYSNRALRVLSGVPGLLLTGQDIGSAGVIGAFYGGMMAASAVLRRNVMKALLR